MFLTELLLLVTAAVTVEFLALSPEEQDHEMSRLDQFDYYDGSDDEVADELAHLSPGERKAELRRRDTNEFFEDSDDEVAGKSTGKSKK